MNPGFVAEPQFFADRKMVQVYKSRIGGFWVGFCKSCWKYRSYPSQPVALQAMCQHLKHSWRKEQRAKLAAEFRGQTLAGPVVLSAEEERRWAERRIQQTRQLSTPTDFPKETP